MIIRKKMVAPILITILMVLYYVLYFGVIISYLDGILKILLGIIPLALPVVMIYVCVQRIKEIKEVSLIFFVKLIFSLTLPRCQVLP
jgi:hypothetical protein